MCSRGFRTTDGYISSVKSPQECLFGAGLEANSFYIVVVYSSIILPHIAVFRCNVLGSAFSPYCF